MPTLYIIAGSNGAGKSSTGPGLLPPAVIKKHPPFDGDKLKSIKQKEFRKQVGSYKEAGRMADEYVDQAFEEQYKYALDHNEDFVYEGHFTEDYSWNLIRIFRDSGYKVDMIFMGLESLEVSLDRVFKRALHGGHNVPPYEVEKNYYGNLYKLNQYFELLDELIILDSSEEFVVQIASWHNDHVKFNVPDEEIPEWITKYLPDLCESNKLSDRGES